MAIASYMNSVGQGAAVSRFSALLATYRARMARRKVYTQTLHELAVLSNRDLADLGLHRSEIKRVAWQAAYEN